MTAKTVIVGCGNGLCGDDTAGLAVAAALKEVKLPEGVELVEAGMPGVGLLDILAGFDKAIIVDAVMSEGEVGSVLSFHLDALETARPCSSLHGFSVAETLSLGMVLHPERLPKQIEFVGIEIDPANLGPGKSMSLPVQDAVAQAVQRVMDLLSQEGLSV
ncbi:hydrogenase maturation protease [Dethiobacter alkaliphilus]|uniref:hydrogenase maturation protease n=1 Tax=Dethiobacter alkaliphilus TaxID=427926 RepID=UPI0022267362|nr:hydrogenase maturation protease [Dethiobacter alkaliphilus]MCW3490332.1 hydrogenase maturation protease [Dethiobacter alkaliphilus]